MRTGWSNYSFFSRIIQSQLRRLKVSAIKKAKVCLNSEMSLYLKLKNTVIGIKLY